MVARAPVLWISRPVTTDAAIIKIVSGRNTSAIL